MITQRQHLGFSLIELLIAVTISGVLIFGATQVYVDSRNTYALHETEARLQETARYALSVIEPDVRMANYWGLFKGGIGITGNAAQTAPVSPLAAGAGAILCGNNFATDLTIALQGRNDAYGLPCVPPGGIRTALTSDMLTVRRASLVQPEPIPAATVGPLRICSNRLTGTLVNVAIGCTGAPGGQVNDLIVNAYYVARDSNPFAIRANVPSLRRWSLTNIPAGAPLPTFVDNELVSGVEDMQVQFGVDPTGLNGVARQYVDVLTAAAMPVTAQIVSVRIWLLVRADAPEQGFVDNRIYIYGNRAGAAVANLNAAGAAGRAYQPNDNFRRLLVSRTIMIRNALGT
jgi:type IV pilus assembly protein PilW